MSYRDEVEGFRAMAEELEGELTRIGEARKDLEGLSAREAKVRAELDEARLRLRLASGKRLPLLDRSYVASPCSAKWDDMVGDERVRFCGKCEKNVYDLSAMSRAEAEELVRENSGKACVRFYRRADGTVMTSDCSVGVRRKRRRKIAAAALATAAAAGGAYALLAHRARSVMGQMEIQSAPVQGGVSGIERRRASGDWAPR